MFRIAFLTRNYPGRPSRQNSVYGRWCNPAQDTSHHARGKARPRVKVPVWWPAGL